MKRKLAAIGGFGAVANESFIQNLNRNFFQGHKKNSKKEFFDSQFPDYILVNYPKDFIDTKGIFLEESKNSILDYFRNIKEPIEFFECTDVVILCNSFHKFLPEIEEILQPGIKLHSIIDPNHFKERNSLVLCSRECLENKIFGENVQYHTRENLIYSAVTQRNLDIPDLRHYKFTELVLGCTDLSLYRKRFEKIFPEKIIHDPLDEFTKKWIGVFRNESF